MPCTPLSSAPRSKSAGNWEPALSQLRRLPPGELERLVAAWLLPPHDRGPGRCRRGAPQNGAVTLHLALDTPPVPLPLGVRIHQRESALQVHHVDAFAGYLVRNGLPAGILISTGSVNPAARAAAQAYRQPRLRLYSGEAWASELATRRLGLERRCLWRWVLALTTLSGRFTVRLPRDGGRR